MRERRGGGGDEWYGGIISGTWTPEGRRRSALVTFAIPSRTGDDIFAFAIVNLNDAGDSQFADAAVIASDEPPALMA